MESDEESKKIPDGMRWQVLITEEVMQEIERVVQTPGHFNRIQGYRVNKKLPPCRTLQQGYA